MELINRQSVHRLCAGQVITDLKGVAKELLENSLDAGANLVEVRTKDHGLSGIWVSDNGQGIEASGFGSLCRKHWTSKLRGFEDLEKVESFGFRGEALSSLCAVSKVVVTTATRDTAPLATQLTYDTEGELVDSKQVARERGTTVHVSGLFEKWPVRRQDLQKNIRREFAKLVSMVDQYGIISDTRISLQGGRCLKSTDQLGRLLEILGPHLRPHMLSIKQERDDIGVAGYMGALETGRTGQDRQWVFVNGRPCELPQVKRLVNQMYRQHNPNKYPVFCLMLEMGKGSVDVNLTPDKRTVLLRYEKQVMEVLRQAVGEVLEPKETLVKVQQTQLSVNKRLRVEAEEAEEEKKKPAATKKPTSTMVVGACRNRIQTDQYDWRSVARRLRIKQERWKQKYEESQQKQQEEPLVDTVREEGGLEGNIETADQALSRLIRKQDFLQMSVLGQFNRGFIICRHLDDLYIVDQHASDEKYNFEQLQRNAQISSQPLIRPAPLELSAADRDLVVEYQQTLEKNGFSLQVKDQDQVFLLSQPVVDQTLFNQQDLLDLVGRLAEEGADARCQRVRRAFASRACRKSVMIGDSLSQGRMEQIIKNLSGLESPWNCPHGRPTLRHLFSI